MTEVTIYHNPDCGTSRNVLGLIRNTGIEPEVILYLNTPPDEETLRRLLQDSGLSAVEALRRNVAPFFDLGLDKTLPDENTLIKLMIENPSLINRPFVVTTLGSALCRPSERVLDILPHPQRGKFQKEDGTLLIDDDGCLISKERK